MCAHTLLMHLRTPLYHTCAYTLHICRKKCSDSFENFQQMISLYVVSKVYKLGAGEEAWSSRALAALAEDPRCDLVPRTSGS